MAVFVFDLDGICLEISRTSPAPPDAAFQANHGEVIVVHRPETDPAPGLKDPGGITAEIVAPGGDDPPYVGSVSLAASTGAVFLHLAFSGGDGEDPPGIKNDGVDALNFTATLRAGADPASPVIPVTAAWRITVRDDVGQVYDVVRVQMAGGEVSAAYTTDGRPALCRLLESDLGPVEPGDGNAYAVRLVGPDAFKVYRELA